MKRKLEVVREVETKKLPEALYELAVAASAASEVPLPEAVYVTLVGAPAAWFPLILPVVGLGEEVFGEVGLDDPRPKAEFRRAVACASAYNGTSIEVAGLTPLMAAEAATGEPGFLEALDICLDANWKSTVGR